MHQPLERIGSYSIAKVKQQKEIAVGKHSGLNSLAVKLSEFGEGRITFPSL
jgi:hypothetical protein